MRVSTRSAVKVRSERPSAVVLRSLTDDPLRYVIYTHGHYDHAFGTPALLDDAAARGHDAPEIVGHRNVAKRFERYAKTSGHIAHTFDAQFASWGPGGGDVVRKARYYPPTIPFEDSVTLDLGDLTLECRHGLGETDDHVWVSVTKPRVIVGGDFIVSSLPNAGTPFRVQRYVLEWAEALEAMAAVEPAAVISGHGGVFTEDAQAMLSTTAEACRWLDAEVVRRLNDGQWDEQILTEVALPVDMEESRYLQPLYGCTAFPCATSSAVTPDGTTATPPCSSPRRGPQSAARCWLSSATPPRSSREPTSWLPVARSRSCNSRCTSSTSSSSAADPTRKKPADAKRTCSNCEAKPSDRSSPATCCARRRPSSASRWGDSVSTGT